MVAKNSTRPAPTSAENAIPIVSVGANDRPTSAIDDSSTPPATKFFLRLTDPKTALRAACLSGAWTAATADGGAGGLALSPGDLDEAVSGLLTDGLMASDVNGVTIPSGFARVDAFRSGVLGGRDACANRYG